MGKKAKGIRSSLQPKHRPRATQALIQPWIQGKESHPAHARIREHSWELCKQTEQNETTRTGKQLCSLHALPIYKHLFYVLKENLCKRQSKKRECVEQFNQKMETIILYSEDSQNNNFI